MHHLLRHLLDRTQPGMHKHVRLPIKCRSLFQQSPDASKRIGGAVKRNRARRILRAAWTEVRPLAGEQDGVLVARAAIDGATSRELVDEMMALLSETAEA